MKTVAMVTHHSTAAPHGPGQLTEPGDHRASYSHSTSLLSLTALLQARGRSTSLFVSQTLFKVHRNFIWKKVINSLGSWANICKARQDPHSSKTDLKLRGFLGECKCIVCVSVLNGVFSWPPLSVDAGQWGSSPFEAWGHSYYMALLKAWPCCIVNRLVQLPFAQQCSKRERGTLEILEPLWDVGEVKST